MREDRVPESRVKAIQDAEMAALSEWQAAHPSGEPRPRRNRAADILAETVGIPAAGVPTPDVIAEDCSIACRKSASLRRRTAAAEAGEIEATPRGGERGQGDRRPTAKRRGTGTLRRPA